MLCIHFNRVILLEVKNVSSKSKKPIENENARFPRKLCASIVNSKLCYFFLRKLHIYFEEANANGWKKNIIIRKIHQKRGKQNRLLELWKCLFSIVVNIPLPFDCPSSNISSIRRKEKKILSPFLFGSSLPLPSIKMLSKWRKLKDISTCEP